MQAVHVGEMSQQLFTSSLHASISQGYVLPPAPGMKKCCACSSAHLHACMEGAWSMHGMCMKGTSVP